MKADTVTARAPAPVAARPRDGFLDVIRTVALLRVTMWHAFGEPFLTYILAAVPTMFFVTGSLLAKSLDRRRAHQVLIDRGRRILVPLWMFAAVAFVAMRAAWYLDPGPSTLLPAKRMVFWLLPLGDPQGSTWEGGWMSQPLWYVRAMFWLVLLSPLLRAALRRFNVWAFVPPLLLVFALDDLGRNPNFRIAAAPQLLWQIGDIGLYAIFLMAGFAHRDGRFEHLRPAQWLRGAAVAAVASAAWILTQPVPLHVVNNSHPAHLLVGTTWLCVLFGLREPIMRVMSKDHAATVISWISQRTMTIYLWHSTAIICTYQLLAKGSHYPFGLYAALMILGMTCATAFFVVCFGWVEDLAAGRPASLCPMPSSKPITSERQRLRHQRTTRRLVSMPAFAGLVLLALVVGVVRINPATSGDGNVTAAATRSTKRPPVPSQAPPQPSFVRATGAAVIPATNGTQVLRESIVRSSTINASAGPIAPDADAALAESLQGALDAWRERWDVPGIGVAVAQPGVALWRGASGVDAFTGRDVSIDDQFDIGSITKTMTGVIVLQLADEGKINLDAPLPRLVRAPAFPYAKGITVRQLLTHRSGLTPYRDTPGFAANPDAVNTPDRALAVALAEPLMFEPGEQSGYSSTNFLVLGMLVEQVTGESFDELLTERVFNAAHLTNITHAPPAPQSPNYATSGVTTDTLTLLQWAVALYRDDVVLDATQVASLHQIDPASGLGPSSYGYCPCTVDDAGVATFHWIGHSGGTTQFVYSTADDLAIVLNVTDSLWDGDRPQAMAELLETLRAIMAEASTPTAFAPFVDTTGDAGNVLGEAAAGIDAPSEATEGDAPANDATPADPQGANAEGTSAEPAPSDDATPGPDDTAGQPPA